MNAMHIVLVCAGVTVNALTFALGIMVGVSMKRKDVCRGNRYKEPCWNKAERR